MTFPAFILLSFFLISLVVIALLAAEISIRGSKIDKLKDENTSLKIHKNFWYVKSQEYYEQYIGAKKKANGNVVTWRNIMGFSKEEPVTKEKLERRYKALARVYHPDLESGSNYAMKLLNLAKEKADKNV